METTRAVFSRLGEIGGVVPRAEVPLSDHTRFGLGGAADLFIDAATEGSFVATLRALHTAEWPTLVIGGGSNLVASDEGYRGAVLRYTGQQIRPHAQLVECDAGVVLQTLVDFSISEGLAGLATMTGIPGWVGGAVYGNAGAYGNSIHTVVESVRFWDGEAIRTISNQSCEFSYRESIFKRRKDWTVFAARFRFTPGDPAAMRQNADEILAIRNAKYPPTMRCAGSIFKNLFFSELPATAQREVPEKLVRDGKVPSAFFLEQVGGKGMRNGGIRVADYHANLIYNEDHGTAAEVLEIITELKARVRDRFCFDLAEEVQFVGFPCRHQTR